MGRGAGEDKARHLDISPALLDGAQRYVARFGDEASPATRALRRRGERRRRGAARPRAPGAGAPPRRRARRSPPPTSASPGAPAIGLVAALALAALAGWQWRAADAAKQDAQAQRDRADTP